VEGYVKLKYSNVALLVGRQSSLVGARLSRGHDVQQQRPAPESGPIGTAEPFFLPGS
jgi:hypothetical protein